MNLQSYVAPQAFRALTPLELDEVVGAGEPTLRWTGPYYEVADVAADFVSAGYVVFGWPSSTPFWWRFYADDETMSAYCEGKA